MNIAELKNFQKPPQSFWMASTPGTDYPILDKDIKVDIAIIGGGFVGISTAYMLIGEGVKIAIIEADRILQGTTGHTTAKVTSQHGLIYNKIKSKMSEEFAKQYADANENAIRTIEKIIKENNIECDFTPQSAYDFTYRDGYTDEMGEEVKVASSLGIQATYLEEIPLPFKIKGAVRFDNQAQFHPRKYLLPLAEKISKQGCQIYEQSRVINIEEDGSYILITDKGKKVTAEKVILASHYPCYNKAGLYFARIWPDRSYALGVRVKEKYPGGMYITAEEPARSLRSQSSDDGELIIIGGEHHKTGQGEDTIKHYHALVDYSVENFTVEDIPFRWSTQDCMTLDDIPYVGRFTSDTPNMYIATGFGKWGMTNSTASSLILRDLIIDGRSPWQEVYNPSRQTVAASAKTFVVENLNVAKELIKGKTEQLPVDPDIREDEGKVIEAEGQRAGAYRDKQGTLHVVNTTCTHMGCELMWNSAEKSWDCPCHGSRFSYEGDIVEGPAVKPLDINNDVNTIERVIKDHY
ncbi:MAG TPA: FAD-dependent oxidoreductase [Clostridia bacterium]|nr:FAD-dependent oxidoreductase [Clostridia bacterium]